MYEITIYVNGEPFGAELNETQTAQAVYEVLPVEGMGRLWGNEIYFDIPVDRGNEAPTEKLEVGDLAYWPGGNAFCIFYGRTPASTDGAPRPASPVTVIGTLTGADPTALKQVEQADIRVVADSGR